MKTIAIIPTINRPIKLIKALNSILNQTQKIDYVIIVHETNDDLPLIDFEKNIHVTINNRTKSLSGAINHAIDEIIINRHSRGK